MTRTTLYEIYEKNYQQAGDTQYDFYEWAIDFLLSLDDWS